MRSIEPRGDVAGDELDVEAGVPDVEAGVPDVEAGEPDVAAGATLPPAPDLGPNGDRVVELLERAARLTSDESRGLEQAASWRWWSVSPILGTGVGAARATAVLAARRGGRSAALTALNRALRDARLQAAPSGRRSAPVATCIANAALAALVRDLVDDETFEVLFGPWRDVMHR